MSYLDPLRLHFAGQFQANVSTVNNDPGHFDNATFLQHYQKRQGPRMRPPNGWFNPEGDAAFRLLGCTVTSAWLPARAVDSSDAVLECIVADSDSAVAAKLVDLDSEQQLVSEIWGLEVRIADANGNTLMAGNYKPAAFMDIWDRATGGGNGDVGAGSAYHSVLSDLRWADNLASPFLQQLKTASEATGMLSIKFNIDGFNMDFSSPDFMVGRVVGSIGPQHPGAPQHLIIGRQFMAVAAAHGNFFTPQGGINFFPALIDTKQSSIYLDLGNALSTTAPGEALNNLGDLTLSAGATSLGTIAATGSDGYASDAAWYRQTAGVVALALSAAQCKAAKRTPLTLTGNTGIEIAEWPNGAFVRADTYVYRASPGDAVEVAVYATQFGERLSGSAVAFSFDSGQLQPTPDEHPYVQAGPPVAAPTSAVQFAEEVTTDAHGIATLVLTLSDPGTPRWFNTGTDYGIDGQVYGIRPTFKDASMNAGPENQWNFISLLLWSGFNVPDPVTWNDIQPIMQQYANLYPAMLRFLNMADEDSVRTHAGIMKLAFGLPVSDPNSMPVTRDLSPAKRAAMLEWLDNPVKSTVSTPRPKRPVAAAQQADSGVPPAAPQGGKAAAAARRLIVQKR
ncbi:MAG: hypothetical protein GKR94_00560 [Gammaproteobacteria bacterium]|nr:hypothetical protein [Gammaproteobacteria bacterium]